VLEDLEGSIELVCFPEVYQRHKEMLKSDIPLFVEGGLSGDIDERQNSEDAEQVFKVLVDRIDTLEDAARRKLKGIALNIDGRKFDSGKLDALKGVMLSYRGDCPVHIFLDIPGKGCVRFVLPDNFRVSDSPELYDALNAVTGYRCVTPLYL
jgi:DNA polymerase-3 subunit alpha